MTGTWVKSWNSLKRVTSSLQNRSQSIWNAYAEGAGAKWMVEMVMYFGENPNGFVKAGIAGALDGHVDSWSEEDKREDESDSDAYKSDADADSSNIMDLTGSS